MTERDLNTVPSGAETWPALPVNEWQDTYETLHMWSQIVGKIRLAQTPLVNHWWNTTLYVTARGLTTSVMPHGNRAFEIDFDFIDHRLVIQTSEGITKRLALEPRSVADFYRELMSTLAALGLEVDIHAKPDEVVDPVPFAEDHKHASYDAAYATRFWRVLLQADRVFKQFRSRFIGKCSPVHFFWGSFDLAVTRFSGRQAPERPGADAITREAYSHEVISHGFWPGGGAVSSPIFYSYTAPAPAAFAEQPIKPSSALYSTEMSEFILPYDSVREAESPDESLLQFMQSTYEAGANLAGWNRAELERNAS
ncbi:MAG: DUF5996 family protein, partial [Blastocatellia bacterium]